MLQLFRTKRNAQFSLAVVLLMWAYFIISSGAAPDPRYDDGVLNLNEMYWYEIILFVPGFVLNFAFIFSAWFHAWKHEQKKLLAGTFLIWPLSFYYVFKYVVEDSNGS